MVKDIESLCPKLEVHVLVHRKGLEESHVEVGPCRQVENVSPRSVISEPSNREFDTAAGLVKSLNDRLQQDPSGDQTADAQDAAQQ
jgi:hypothetical protein